MPDKDQNLDEQMERDTEIRRETQVRDALGPIEGTDAERNAAESPLSEQERAGRSRSDSEIERAAGRPADSIGRAHIERGARSDESMTADTESGDVSNEEDR